MSYWELINTPQLSTLKSVGDFVKITTMICTVHFIIAPELAANGFLSFLFLPLPSRPRAQEENLLSSSFVKSK